MKKKTISVISLLMCVIFAALCLASCNSADNQKTDTVSSENSSSNTTSIKDVFDMTKAYAESNIDVTGMQLQTDDENEGSLYAYWTFDEPQDNVAMTYDLEIDGNAIKILTTTEKEVEDMGFEVSKYSDMVEPDESQSVTANKDGKEMVLTLKTNNTKSNIPVGELPVYGFDGYYNEFSLPFSYNGFTDKTTIKDVIGILGNPNSGVDVSVEEFSGNEYTSYIKLSYSNIVPSGNTEFSEILTFEFKYDPSTNSETIYCISYSADEYTVDQE